LARSSRLRLKFLRISIGHLLVTLRPIFTWALNQAAIETNPMSGMKGPQTPKAGDRVLWDEEARTFWQAASAESACLFSVKNAASDVPAQE